MILSYIEFNLKVHDSLSTTDKMKFIHALVPRLVLPKSFTKQLQSIQDTAARMLTGTRLRNQNQLLNPFPVYPHLTELIWLSSYFEMSLWCNFYIYLQWFYDAIWSNCNLLWTWISKHMCCFVFFIHSL